LSVQWITRAAMQGQVQAMSLLGQWYYTGQGVNQNVGLALQLLQKAALQGDADAQGKLAAMYLAGKDVKRDLQQAYIFASLAVMNNGDDAILRRDAIGAALSPQQLGKAQVATRNFVGQNPGAASPAALEAADVTSPEASETIRQP